MSIFCLFVFYLLMYLCICFCLLFVTFDFDSGMCMCLLFLSHRKGDHGRRANCGSSHGRTSISCGMCCCGRRTCSSHRSTSWLPTTSCSPILRDCLRYVCMYAYIFRSGYRVFLLPSLHTYMFACIDDVYNCIAGVT